MDKPWTTLRVAQRLPTGRRLPTSSTVLDPIGIKSGKVKTISPAPALAYSNPVAVQTTGTSAKFKLAKVEALGGYASTIFLVGVAVLMFYQSTERLLSPISIRYDQAITVIQTPSLNTPFARISRCTSLQPA